MIFITFVRDKFNFFKLVKFDKEFISDIYFPEKSNSSIFLNILICCSSSIFIYGKSYIFKFDKFSKGEISDTSPHLIFNISKLTKFFKGSILFILELYISKYFKLTIFSTIDKSSILSILDKSNFFRLIKALIVSIDFISKEYNVNSVNSVQ